jgi:NADH-quinone oxidoreductase subunit J
MTATAYELIAFGLFAAITLGSSVGVVIVQDVWHAVLLLGVALLSVAVHFILLSADFLAVIQILVYVGGVVVLISFAVMLIRREGTDPWTETRPQLNVGRHLFKGVGAVGLFIVLIAVALTSELPEAAGYSQGSITASIGYALVGLNHLALHQTENFLVALIILAILLDAALDAAVMLAKRDDEGAT